MMETACTYTDRDDLLVAHLYDDIEPAERAAFTAHLAACGRCSRELADLRGVRTTLSAWTPPEPARATSHGESGRATSHEPRATDRSWHDIPAWAQVAAALLVLGVSAGVANVDVRRDSNGWTVRTGWWTQPAPASGRPDRAPSTASAVATADQPQPWRADLTALEQELRSELRSLQSSTRAVSAVSTMSDAELKRRVRSILDESERRQERELALRVAEVVKEVNAQRQADLVKIDRSLGFIQSNTYGEAMKQRELINYLVKASQKQ